MKIEVWTKLLNLENHYTPIFYSTFKKKLLYTLVSLRGPTFFLHLSASFSADEKEKLPFAQKAEISRKANKCLNQDIYHLKTLTSRITHYSTLILVLSKYYCQPRKSTYSSQITEHRSQLFMKSMCDAVLRGSSDALSAADVSGLRGYSVGLDRRGPHRWADPSVVTAGQPRHWVWVAGSTQERALCETLCCFRREKSLDRLRALTETEAGWKIFILESDHQFGFTIDVRVVYCSYQGYSTCW